MHLQVDILPAQTLEAYCCTAFADVSRGHIVGDGADAPNNEAEGRTDDLEAMRCSDRLPD
jgi:hypothetical protein